MLHTDFSGTDIFTKNAIIVDTEPNRKGWFFMQKLYYGGDIITMVNETDAPEALLVCDGKIQYVGSRKEAERLAKEEAEKIDLAGKTLMPSFIDPHSHISMYSQFSEFADLSECTNFNEIVEVLKQYQEEKQIGEDGILMGTGYDHNFLTEEAHPTREVLDRVSETIPICLFHTSGHMAVANTALLKLAGLTEESKEPEGGHYGRDEKGNLNGYLEEVPALTPVFMAAFSRIKTDPVQQMKKVQDIYLRYGITTVQDGSINQETFKKLLSFAKDGMFKLDVVAYLISDEKGIDTLLHAYPKVVGRYENRFKIGGAKIILDGSPQGKTAWLTKPYQGEKTYCGYPAHSDKTVEAAVSAAVNGGYQILAHCNGDAASDQYLRCYKKALAISKKTNLDLRPVMIHCQTVRDDQLDRMAEIGMIPSIFVAHTYFWGDIHLKNLGKERGSRISPAKSALERGLIYNFHQDSPVLPPDMMRTVWCAVNRITRKGVKIGEKQCISVFDALKGITIHAAYAYHEEQEKGTLEAGKLADLVILELNPLKVDKLALADIAVMETIKEGETLFKREEETLS